MAERCRAEKPGQNFDKKPGGETNKGLMELEFCFKLAGALFSPAAPSNPRTRLLQRVDRCGTWIGCQELIDQRLALG